LTVYISIGNSDDKLTQAEWSQYVVEIIARVVSIGHTHGAWFSLPHTAYQNACWCVEFDNAEDLPRGARWLRRSARSGGRIPSHGPRVPATEFI